MSRIFELRAASSPLLISVPHAGTDLPADIERRLTPLGAALPDTDWFVDTLWDFGSDFGAGMLIARYSRYVVDLNRPPDDTALYAGAGTGLVPETTFAGERIYRKGEAPRDEERASRVDRFWSPYHDALASELEKLRSEHGFAVLLDAHSIRHRVPRLFDGALPDLNLGSHRGRSAAGSLIECAAGALERWRAFSSVVDGRFTGGYITRHYGRPQEGVHALQMEMAQRIYMNEEPPQPDPKRRQAVRRFTRDLLEGLRSWRPAHG